jgi:error-prone DNA polymerase
MAVRLGLRQVRGLRNQDGAAIVLARGEEPYTSVEEIQRRAGVAAGALDRIGQANGFGSLAPSRRSGLWQVKGLRDAALPLFTAADERDGRLRPEATEPIVPLAAMTEGQEVVEDYRATGLSLRAHPLAFLRDELARRSMVPCSALRAMKDGRPVTLAGIVLVRQKPGSAKGVMFITLEDETDIANLVVWPDLFEKHRRVVFGSSMMGVRGRVQREGDVIHVVAQRLDDLSPMLASVGTRDEVADVYRVSRADVVKHGMGPDPRDPAEQLPDWGLRNLLDPNLCLELGIVPGQPTEGIKVKSRNFH